MEDIKKVILENQGEPKTYPFIDVSNIINIEEDILDNISKELEIYKFAIEFHKEEIEKIIRPLSKVHWVHELQELKYAD